MIHNYSLFKYFLVTIAVMYSKCRIVCHNYKNKFFHHITTQLSLGGVVVPGGNPSMFIGPCSKVINVVMKHGNCSYHGIC